MAKMRPGSKRDLIIRVVVNKKERAAVAKRASKAGMSMSSFTRQMALFAPFQMTYNEND
jgi:hypothetical protein